MSISERPDYSTLLGFVAPAERIDPHPKPFGTDQSNTGQLSAGGEKVPPS